VALVTPQAVDRVDKQCVTGAHSIEDEPGRSRALVAGNEVKSDTWTFFTKRAG
jgi:hypothetical protein